MREYFLIDSFINDIINMFDKYSLTYTGVIVSVLATLASYLGLQIGSDALTTTVITLFQFGGAIVALIGRWRAGGVSMLGAK